jgi:hypothetical protein
MKITIRGDMINGTLKVERFNFNLNESNKLGYCTGLFSFTLCLPDNA